MRCLEYANSFQLLTIFALIAASKSFAVDNHNEFYRMMNIVNSANTTWKAGESNLDGLSKEKFKGLLGARLDEEVGDATAVRTARDFFDKHEIPEHFDARDHWRNCKSIGHVRDQANCGSCWAVAAAEALTDRFCIASKGKIQTQLSMEDILSCCNECGYGCEGGYINKAWNFFKTNGIVSGGDYDSHEGCKPYSIAPCSPNPTGKKCHFLDIEETPTCSPRCTNSRTLKSYKNDLHKVKNYYRLADEVAIQREILHSGSVEAGFAVYLDFRYYKSGIYQHVFGPRVGGHAIKIIGWGVENGLPYWLIVNSWTTRWGENGLFRIVRGRNECDIESRVYGGQPDLANHFQ